MFTNWLTSASGTNNNNNTSNNNIISNVTNNLNHNIIENRSTSNSVNLHSNTNLITNASGGHILMSTPPDVILEVGPAPNTVRFVAHSIVLGMHSGYLRSAIRLDEQILAERNLTTSTATQDFILYLGNVTAEQFAPLLTYMYTGYLDLNVENIFGVLLATHVLHMPRALEICRSFLARAQAEGYLGARLNNTNLTITNQLVTATNVNNNHNKIIRPIPSKATIPNFGFLPTVAAQQTNLNLTTTNQQQPPQHQQHATMPIILENFKNLERQSDFLPETQQQSQQLINSPIMNNEIIIEKQQNERAKSEEIDVDQESVKAASEKDEKNLKEIFKLNKQAIDGDNDDDDVNDEDEEVFIDSSDVDNSDNDETKVIIEVKQKQQKLNKNNKTVIQRHGESESHQIEKSTKIESIPIRKSNNKKNENLIKAGKGGTSYSKAHNQHQNTKRRGSGGGAIKSRSNNNSSGLQIAKAPIPASQLDANEGSKVIIDVASCDGPVRFRRILNTAYGHKPEDFTTQLPTERSQQSVSYSFHQQMARTIHHQQQQQRQQIQQNAIVEESENSESSGGGGGGVGAGSKHSKNPPSNNNSNEIYICVYCKHTFKSQYCYQKHAKRHLNPLSLNSGERCEKTAIASCTNSLSLFNSNTTTSQFNLNATGGSMSMPLLTTKQTANDLLRREVRPLDMNVQYYPCKTCGSKFPSYYFVHKHRKLCHADEELTTEKSVSGNKFENSHTNVEIDVGCSSNRVPQPPLPPSTQDFDATKMNTSASNGNSDIDVQQQVKHEN